eukprot:snap_masked-scaffold_30-processed-gene-1.21-mRNA-1 protein AED:1.00 eAED:1.00 QI:0/0/0/0/1/1/2/0/91
MLEFMKNHIEKVNFFFGSPPFLSFKPELVGRQNKIIEAFSEKKSTSTSSSFVKFGKTPNIFESFANGYIFFLRVKRSCFSLDSFFKNTLAN